MSTKFELIQINNQLAADLVTLRAAHSQLSVDLHMLRADYMADAAYMAAHPAPRSTVRTGQPVVTYYTDRVGRTWEKTRVGNAATSTLIAVAHASA